VRFRPRVVELPAGGDVPGRLSRLRSRAGLVALDSAAGAPRRFGLVAFDPLAGAEPPAEIAGLRALLAGVRREQGDAVPGPFHGGFLGALAYDLGVAGERPLEVAPDPWRSPRVAGGVYVDFVVEDSVSGSAWLVLGDDPGDGRPALEVRRREILDLLRAPAPVATPPRPLGPLVRHVPPAEHRARIERARALIAAGDFYQANLAHRFTRAVEGDPVDLYLRLRERNPAPYMGYLRFEGGALLSASPELLLEYDPEYDMGRARTRPIKGTAPRAASPEEDERLARALLASGKDRAELAMIVDLERNDLGRVCEPGSVVVERHPHLETYATVHHLAADVVGTPRAGVDAVDLLAALFPGGSITGAPKLAAMAAIARLEGEGRGFFTGSLGFVDLRGRAAFNILIRTLVWRRGPPAAGSLAPRGEVSFHVGGGITWSSEAGAEDDETLTKAAGLAAALEEPASGALRGGSEGRKGLQEDPRGGRAGDPECSIR
jgi:para-aminobenzoate synthetase component 1